MNNSILILIAEAIFISSISALALPPGALPRPEFEKKNFLLTTDIPEMNVDFAIAWTDSAASFLVYGNCGQVRPPDRSKWSLT